MTTTEILTFTRLRVPAGGVLTVEHEGLRATVVLVVPGGPGRMPTYLWTIVGAADAVPVAAGYGEGVSIACAEATAAIAQRASATFAAFTVVDEVPA